MDDRKGDPAVALKTTIVAPDNDLFARAVNHASAFRDGKYGKEVRKNHYNAVFLYGPGGDNNRHEYEIHIWGDPNGHVRAYAYRIKK